MDSWRDFVDAYRTRNEDAFLDILYVRVRGTKYIVSLAVYNRHYVYTCSFNSPFPREDTCPEVLRASRRVKRTIGHSWHRCDFDNNQIETVVRYLSQPFRHVYVMCSTRFNLVRHMSENIECIYTCAGTAFHIRSCGTVNSTCYGTTCLITRAYTMYSRFETIMRSGAADEIGAGDGSGAAQALPVPLQRQRTAVVVVAEATSSTGSVHENQQQQQQQQQQQPQPQLPAEFPLPLLRRRTADANAVNDEDIFYDSDFSNEDIPSSVSSLSSSSSAMDVDDATDDDQ